MVWIIETFLEAIKKSNSKNIDVSSGVESSPGVKSKELINKFIHKIRSLEAIIENMENKKINFNFLKNQPSEDGKFGEYGGMFVAETLMPLILSLSKNYNKLKKSTSFQEKLKYYQKNYIGRPSPLYFANRITDYCGGAKIFFKKDELNHTGAHKINNVIGQALLAKEMGKNKIIAETGAGQHGVATATVCAL